MMTLIPRQSRIDALGALHHVIIRGIERKAIFKDLGALDRYLFAGHSVIMGNQPAAWQDDDRILGMFAKTKKAARRKYRVERARPGQRRRRILGDGEFVQSVLDRCHEDYSRRQRRIDKAWT